MVILIDRVQPSLIAGVVYGASERAVCEIPPGYLGLARLLLVLDDECFPLKG